MSIFFPQYIQLYPTMRCNQNCSFCFNSSALPLNDLSYERSLSFLKILGDIGISGIDVMGGEPLLLPWMPDFVETALNRNITVNISTNGSMSAAVRRFEKIKGRSFNIGISLEGSSHEKHAERTSSGHYLTALESIRSLVALDLDPIVKTVLSRSSVGDIQNIVNLARNLGVRRFYLIHLDLLSRDKDLSGEVLGYVAFQEHFHKIRDDNRDISVNAVHASCFQRTMIGRNARCAGGVRKLAVLPDGSVYPCNLLISFGEFRLGNIFKDDFISLWENPILDFFREFRTNSCGIDSCSNQHFCSGGCPAHGLYHYGNPDHHDIRCLMR